jgi:4a-hydroxytetrahydrobiopterin dehydratase
MADRRPLSPAELEAALPRLPDWRAEGGVLGATFATTTVADALALIAAIGALAEELDHHPDVDWRYRHVNVASTTHSAGGRLTGLDVALAERISVQAARLGATAAPV